MESTLTLVVLIAVACWCYRDGKRKGSRLGFSAGRRQAYRRRQRSK